MDLRLHARILARWRVVLATGLVAAVLLAVLATFKPSTAGLEWRAVPSYTSQSRTFVTQRGFPIGRATLPGSDDTGTVDPTAPNFAPSTRFSELAILYSYFAQSDPVRKLMTPAPIHKQISVATVPNSVSGDPLPMLEIATTASSPTRAQSLNRAVVNALRSYLNKNVLANDVPADERVELQVINPPRAGTLVGGRSITLSVIVFLLTLVATLVAVYVLENLYPSRTGLRQDDDQELVDIGALFEQAAPGNGAAAEGGLRERPVRRGSRSRSRNRAA